MSVSPAEKKLFELLAKRFEKNPPKPLEEQSIADFREGSKIFSEFTGKHSNVKFKEYFIPSRNGYQIPIRIYHSDKKANTPVLIMYPGCAYVVDLFESNAIACSRIAKYSAIKVILVNFRLAPEHPVPTAIYDAYDATQYIATHADQFHIDPNKIFIGGLSSGAHSATVIANLARKDDKLKIYHQILLNGVYDLTGSNHEYDDYEKEDKIFLRETLDFILKHWGIAPTEYKNPLFSPYFETDLAGLPPTTFIIGEYDGLRNDSEAYYKKVKAAGNRVEKIVLKGQTHNTLIMRGAMSDGKDPAEIIAEVIRRDLCHL